MSTVYPSRQWLKSEDIQRISLFFHNKSLEKEVRSSTSKLAPFTLQWIYIGVVISATHRNILLLLVPLPTLGLFWNLVIYRETCGVWVHSCQLRSIWSNFDVSFKSLLLKLDLLFILLVQSNNLASLQILCHLRLSHLFLHFYRADSRPSKVRSFYLLCITQCFTLCWYGKQYIYSYAIY